MYVSLACNPKFARIFYSSNLPKGAYYCILTYDSCVSMEENIMQWVTGDEAAWKEQIEKLSGIPNSDFSYFKV